MPQNRPTRPALAVFPKGFLDDLVVHKTMSVLQWIELASTLGIDGLEFYAGFLPLGDPDEMAAIRESLAEHKLAMPMLCCSPDFTAPNLDEEIEKERAWIDATAFFGGAFCRVLSGQRRPELSLADGIERVAGAIETLLPYAAERGVTLILENHYKDNYWVHPEFAQKKDVFAALVNRIEHPNFAVNYDPSNAFLAGDDPLDVLDLVIDRVATMHASDRYLTRGTIDDLRREEDSLGYASRLAHGVIGRGLNDYDAIFSRLKAAGKTPFWVSIEDGIGGMDDLVESVAFVKAKLDTHFAP